MPHALFLGSSLAGVDRLKMKPIAPEPKTKLDIKLPSLFKRKQKGASNITEEIEMDQVAVQRSSEPTASTSADPTRSTCSVAEMEEGKQVFVVEEDSEYEAAMKLYEEEIKTFDRIEWVDIHLRHATVRPGQ